MNTSKKERLQRLEKRRAKDRKNLFSRLPVLYATSRTQGVRLLQYAGGLSILEWRTIWDLHEAGPLSVRDLADLQGADHSLISRALPEMKRKGYVVMRRDEGDGRQMIVELTEVGQAIYQQSAPIMKRRRDSLRAEFTEEEIKTFLTYIDRFEEFLRRPVARFLPEESSDDEAD